MSTDPFARPIPPGDTTGEPLDGAVLSDPAAEAAAVETTESTEAPVFATPIYARSRKRKGPPAPAIAVAGLALVLIAAAGYFALKPRDGLFADRRDAAEIAQTAAPTAPATQVAAAAPPAPTLAPTPAVTPVPAPVEKATPIRQARLERPARTRVQPAPVADSPETWASDTSATLPEAPLPYSATVTPAPDAPSPQPPEQPRS